MSLNLPRNLLEAIWVFVRERHNASGHSYPHDSSAGAAGAPGADGAAGATGATGPAGTTLHSGLSDVTSDQHHAQAHEIDGADHTATSPLSVAKGGSGAATLTDHGVLLGSGTAAITPMAVLTKGQLLVGQSAADPTALAIGTDGHVLTLDSAQAAGVKWAAAAGGGSGHEIRENGVAQTTLAGLDFIDADAGATLVNDGATANKVQLDLYVLRGVGRAGGTTIYGGSAANENLILGGTSHATHATSIISALDDIQIATGKVIKDGSGNARITLSTTAGANVTLTGDVTVTGTASGITFSGATEPFTGITMNQTRTMTGTAWTGISIAPNLTIGANSTSIFGLSGNAQAVMTGSTGANLSGLSFIAYVLLSSGTTSTVTALYGASVKAQVATVLASTTRTIGVTDQTVLRLERALTMSTSGAAVATFNVTTSYGINLFNTFSASGAGTEAINVTTMYGMSIGATALSNAGIVITTAIQLFVGDLTGTSFTAANNRVVQFGTATPTTTSGLFEMMANFTAAANVTPIFISEGATPTRRQLKTFDPGNLGVNFTAGQLVCVLV